MRPTFAIFVVVLAGCGGERLGRDLGAIQVSAGEVDFPQTFVGYPTSRAVKLLNSASGARHVTLAASGPFQVDEGLDVSGGSSVDVPVRFVPQQAGTWSGALTLVSDGRSSTVKLSGSASAAPTCGAGSTCSPNHFDSERGACVTSEAPDGTTCADNLCLVDGHCENGTCVGPPRDCGDANACTTDACDPTLGCLHQDLTASCPAPSDPCHVATCDPSGGCGVDSSPDGTVCGSVDCQTAHVCILGSCHAVTPPDGFECAPATPCQAHGTCQQGQCVQPEAGVLPIAWMSSDDWALSQPALGPDGNLYWYSSDALHSTTPNGFDRWTIAVQAVPVVPLALGRGCSSRPRPRSSSRAG